LFKKVGAANVAQEHHDFERLDIGSRGDHVHGRGDAWVVTVAEQADDGFGLIAAVCLPGDDFCFRSVLGDDFPADAAGAGPVGDLLAEVVAFTKFLADDLDDVFGVVIVLGEDEGLGDGVAPGTISAKR
jgi:hypothetical protein